MKNIITLVFVLIVSHFLAFPTGQWFDSAYVSGGFIHVGPFPGYLVGFLFSYIFLSALSFSVLTKRIKIGFYWALPVLVIDLILGAFNPQLWMDALLLAVGLGLAWVILQIKNKVLGK